MELKDFIAIREHNRIIESNIFALDDVTDLNRNSTHEEMISGFAKNRDIRSVPNSEIEGKYFLMREDNKLARVGITQFGDMACFDGDVVQITPIPKSDGDYFKVSIQENCSNVISNRAFRIGSKSRDGLYCSITERQYDTMLAYVMGLARFLGYMRREIDLILRKNNLIPSDYGMVVHFDYKVPLMSEKIMTHIELTDKRKYFDSLPIHELSKEAWEYRSKQMKFFSNFKNGIILHLGKDGVDEDDKESFTIYRLLSVKRGTGIFEKLTFDLNDNNGRGKTFTVLYTTQELRQLRVDNYTYFISPSTLERAHDNIMELWNRVSKKGRDILDYYFDGVLEPTFH